MSDTIDPKEGQPETEVEKVGDIVRKERVTRRITVDAIAKDLKLNASYIKAIESNDYANLPADPYIRVYLRSIASYLMLDPEVILRKFFEDRGVSHISYEDEKATKINVSVKRDTNQSPPWIVIALGIIALIIFAIIAYKSGWIASSTAPVAPAPAVIEDSIADTGAAISEDSIADTVTGQLMAKSATEQAAAVVEEKDGKAVDEKAAETAKKNIPPADTMKLVLSVIKDSVWVHIFCDGVSWKNFIYAKSSRVFSAVDSFNIHVGHNQLLHYTLNGSALKIAPKGVAIFKLDRVGTSLWNYSRWNATFKGRLE